LRSVRCAHRRRGAASLRRVIASAASYGSRDRSRYVQVERCAETLVDPGAGWSRAKCMRGVRAAREWRRGRVREHRNSCTRIAGSWAASPAPGSSGRRHLLPTTSPATSFSCSNNSKYTPAHTLSLKLKQARAHALLHMQLAERRSSSPLSSKARRLAVVDPSPAAESSSHLAHTLDIFLSPLLLTHTSSSHLAHTLHIFFPPTGSHSPKDSAR